MTLMSSDRDEVITNAAVVGGSDDHVSTKLRCTKPAGDDGGWAVWDTWGVSENTYGGRQVRLLLEGLFAGNFDMSMADNIIEHQAALKRAVKSAHERQQHAVLLSRPTE